MTMAGGGLPDPLRKRELLYGAPQRGEAPAELARRYLAAGRHVEALDFFDRARDVEGARAVVAAAVESGDGFLLQRVALCFPELVTSDTRLRAARHAQAAGKLRYALRLYEAAGDEEQAQAIRERLQPPAGEGSGACG